MKRRRKKLIYSMLFALILMVSGILAWFSFRYSDTEIMRCTAVIETKSYDEISIDGHPKLFVGNINSASSLAHSTTIKDSLHKNVRFNAGFWINRCMIFPSCQGHVVTAGIASPLARINDSAVTNHVIRQLKTIFTAHHDSLISIADELNYYLRVHGVQDEGFHTISQYAAKLRHEQQRTDSVLAVIKRLTAQSKITIHRRTTYTLLYYGNGQTPQRIAAKLIRRNDKDKLALLQTVDQHTPDGICAVNLLPWHQPIMTVVKTVSHPGLALQLASPDSICPGNITGIYRQGRVYGLPKLLVADGSPLFSANGIYIGTLSGGQLISRSRVTQLSEKAK